jgi:TIR domain/Pentapeptide repeats (8 copies)
VANEEDLKILRKGPEAWNQWRWQNRDMSAPPLDLRGADLRGARLAWADLSGLDLLEANLSEASFGDADVRGALLYRADLTRAQLGGADLSIANLREAVLDGADLSRAYVRGSVLAGAHLCGARLIFANLSDSNLSEANLSGADLTKVNLADSNLNEANLSQALLDGTRFGNNDLSRVKGLEAVQHNGPSTIGIDTIYESKGKIPEVFLREAGVPEPFIANMKALVAAMEPIQFYSCFISYSSKDQEFAERLYADLQSRNVRCWFAPHDVQGGKKLHEQIDEATRVHEKLLLILSPDSMGSEWVKTEIAKARKREVRENRRVLFPMRLCSFEALRDWECFDADTGKDSAREIREYLFRILAIGRSTTNTRRRLSG